MNETRTLMVAHDFSEHALAALFTAADLARRLEAADLHLLHVIRPIIAPTDYAGIAPAAFDMGATRDAAERTLEAIAESIDLEATEVSAHVVQGVSIPESIGEAASRVGADLIVMGTGARSGIANWLLGSVTEKTLRTAPCPVLTVPPSACEVVDGTRDEARRRASTRTESSARTARWRR